MELENLIKEYVGTISGISTSVNIYVLISDSIMVINNDNTTLSVVNIGFQTGMYTAFRYTPDNLGAYLNNDPMIFANMTAIWNKYETLSKQLPVLGEVPDMRMSEEFVKLLNLKSDDGAGFLKIPGNNVADEFLVPVFTGFPKLNKQDSVGLVVKRIDRCNLLMEYHIYKKKIKENIVIYFHVIDMNRRLVDEQFIVK